jgi:CRP/FNR family cyclic AMP-dependent transcriptional regulator
MAGARTRLDDVNQIAFRAADCQAGARRLLDGYDSGEGINLVTAISAGPHWQLVAFSKAQRIYAEGDAADRLYVVVSGAVKLSRSAPFGSDMLTVVGPQEMFGALSLFDPGPRRASAIALSDVRAAAIDHRAIRSMIQTHPRIAEQLLQLLARRLKRTNDDLADQMFTDATGRVAKCLLQLARRIGAPEGDALRVVHNLTQAEIGQVAGVSRETVSKSMTNFARRGWIRVDGPSILIRNPQRLARRAR